MAGNARATNAHRIGATTLGPAFPALRAGMPAALWHRLFGRNPVRGTA
jgi:hypothetical protein